MSTYQGIRQGKLNDLVHQLETEQMRKRDLVVPATAMKMVDGNLIIDDLPQDLFSQADLEKLLADFAIKTSEQRIQFEPTELCEGQIASKLDVPAGFYRKLKSEHLDLLDHNVSTLLERTDKNYFVRTFAPTDEDGGSGLIRAFLSDRYRVVDHLHILDAVLRSIKSIGAPLEIGHCNLTDRSMYVEFVNRNAKITAEEYIQKYQSPDGGDDPFIYSGFVISNSETGSGSYQVVPRAIVGACNNGMLFKRDALAKSHIGSQMDEGIKWSQKTLNKEVEFIESQIEDAVATFADTEYIQKKFEEMQQHTERLEHPTEAVHNVCNELKISKEERGDIMNYFMDGGQFSAMGVTQAITYHAHEHENADRQYELEGDAVAVLDDNFRTRFDKPSSN